MNVDSPLDNAIEAAASFRSQLTTLSEYFMLHGEARRAEVINKYAGWLDGVEIHLECLKPNELESRDEARAWGVGSR